MTIAATVAERGARLVRANGIDIAYVEAGDGPPLVLLHGGLGSTGPIWADQPVAYVSHMTSLAKHFRVIAPTPAAGAPPSMVRGRRRSRCWPMTSSP